VIELAIPRPWLVRDHAKPEPPKQLVTKPVAAQQLDASRNQQRTSSNHGNGLTKIASQNPAKLLIQRWSSLGVGELIVQIQASPMPQPGN